MKHLVGEILTLRCVFVQCDYLLKGPGITWALFAACSINCLLKKVVREIVFQSEIIMSFYTSIFSGMTDGEDAASFIMSKDQFCIIPSKVFNQPAAHFICSLIHAICTSYLFV